MIFVIYIFKRLSFNWLLYRVVFDRLGIFLNNWRLVVCYGLFGMILLRGERGFSWREDSLVYRKKEVFLVTGNVYVVM